jgi:hypothetical protein
MDAADFLPGVCFQPSQGRPLGSRSGRPLASTNSRLEGVRIQPPCGENGNSSAAVRRRRCSTRSRELMLRTAIAARAIGVVPTSLESFQRKCSVHMRVLASLARQ